MGYGEAVLCGGIDLTVHAGEYVSLVGPPGCGKSALIAVMLGALEPMAGQVIRENGLRREEIGCMPQDSEIRGNASVRDTVMAGCLGQMRHLFVGRAERAMVTKQLERLGIADLEKRRIGELSGGQRQRVFLARALCGRKRLLLLDEPLKGLDQALKQRTAELILENSRDKAILLVTHDREEAALLAERVLVYREGRFVPEEE